MDSLSKSTLRRISRTIEIAKALKPAKQNGENFHVTAIYDKSRLVSLGHNDYEKPHPEKRFGKYSATRYHQAKYTPCRHSEVSSIMASGRDDFSDLTFINVRITNSGGVGMARPCVNCLSLMHTQIGFKCIYYTQGDGTIGVIKPN
jgi:hypothetical protein